MGKNRQKSAFAATERRKLPLRPVKSQTQVIFTHQKCLKANKYGRKQLL